MAVLVLYKSDTCGHCRQLERIWNDVKQEVTKSFPDIRFATVRAKDNGGKFDERLAPRGVFAYSKWFPMVFLVPGPVWDNAMAHLDQDIEIRHGVQIMNATWKKEGKDSRGRYYFDYENKYNVRKPESFVQWIQDALGEFANEQVRNPATFQFDTEPVEKIQPLITTLTAPKNTSTSHIITSTPKKPGDLCSMRIVSRPPM